MNYKVLITTSGIGSRLGDLTDFTNKSLIRIGDKPTISHIIDNYPKTTRFVITTGHYGEYVKEFIDITYPDIDVEYVSVDNYHGPGSSLAYSILQAKSTLQCPFIFNACDTIIEDNSVLLDAAATNQNFCIGARRMDTSQYSTLLVDDGEVLQIKSKGELNFDFAYTGVCGVADYHVFWQELEKKYSLHSQETGLFEGDVINEMLKTLCFKFFETDTWFDMGNVGELEKTRKHFTTSAEVLEKKEESIYFFEESVVKFFSDSSVNQNRVARAKALSPLVPDIIDSGKNFYKYRKVKGELLANSVTEHSFRKLLEWSKENLWIKKDCNNISKLCYDFYIKKSLGRVEKFLENKKDTEKFINGRLVPSTYELFNLIDTDWLCDGMPSQFHGDFILDNILETETGFCLLDWRQDFGGDLLVGDLYYDLAKLNHNLVVNHEIVNKKQFNHTADDCYIMCKTNLLECKRVLRDFIQENGYDYKKVMVLTSVIWINMAPLHEYPFNKFLFNFGKYNLHKALNNEY